MRLWHNGLAARSLQLGPCAEKVLAGGTLNASNLPDRGACFPSAEDWVGVVDSWQASPPRAVPGTLRTPHRALTAH